MKRRDSGELRSGVTSTPSRKKPNLAFDEFRSLPVARVTAKSVECPGRTSICPANHGPVKPSAPIGIVKSYFTSGSKNRRTSGAPCKPTYKYFPSPDIANVAGRGPTNTGWPNSPVVGLIATTLFAQGALLVEGAT